MDALLPQRLEFSYDKGKLLRISLICFGFGLLTAGVTFLPDKPGHHPPSAVLMWPAAALCALTACELLWRLFRNRPGLVISPAGVHIATFAAETVPWLAIRTLQRVQGKRVDNIVIRIDPDVAKTLNRRGIVRWLPKALRSSGTKASVSLKILWGDPDWIFDQCMAFLTNARNLERNALSENSSSTRDNAEGEMEPVFSVKGPPLFTYALIAFLAIIYVGELRFGVGAPQAGSPSTQTLFMLGGTLRESVVQGGEWWRLFTAPFMHGSVIHLVLNCLALWRAGLLLGRLIGWRWFAGLFCISALGGSVASVLINPANIVGVGASGGIIGLFAAVIAASFHFPSGPLPSVLRIGAIQILIPSLLPFVSQTADGMQIDYAAHLGGALAGGTAALLLLAVWPRERPNPRFGGAALTCSIVFAAIATGSLWPISQTRAAFLLDPFAQYFQGRYQEAAEDFAIKAQRNETAAPYYYLWRFIAQSRANDSRASTDLRAEAGKMDQGKWPYPVYKLFLGELSPTEVTAKASNNNDLCEAIFYIGELHMLRGEVDDARPKFQAALLSCPTTFMEYDGARNELSGLTRNGH